MNMDIQKHISLWFISLKGYPLLYHLYYQNLLYARPCANVFACLPTARNRWCVHVSPILLSPLFIPPRQNYKSCTAWGNPNSLECIKRNPFEIILLHALISQNALRDYLTCAYITLKGQEVGKGLPCLKTREWANERVKECSIRRLLGWWRTGERGQTALFIAKQLPVRYFCCNGRRKMKHFSGELIKGTLW